MSYTNAAGSYGITEYGDAVEKKGKQTLIPEMEAVDSVFDKLYGQPRPSSVTKYRPLGDKKSK